MSVTTILPAAPITPAALDLRQCMRDLSEENYCAGWMTGLEFALWEAMLRGGTGCWMRYGLGWLCNDDADALLWFSLECGGWWYWPEREFFLLTNEEQFTSLEHWQPEYERYAESLYGIRRMTRRLTK